MSESVISPQLGTVLKLKVPVTTKGYTEALDHDQICGLVGVQGQCHHQSHPYLTGLCFQVAAKGPAAAGVCVNVCNPCHLEEL